MELTFPKPEIWIVEHCAPSRRVLQEMPPSCEAIIDFGGEIDRRTKGIVMMGDTQDEDRLQRLDRIRGLAAEGSYDAALAIVEGLLHVFPEDVDALQLKGHVLELKTFDEYEYSSKKLMTSSEYLLARRCYEQALQLQPKNTAVLIDLGDHYKNLDAYDKAFSYYEAAISLLRDGVTRRGVAEDVDQLLGSLLDLSRNGSTAETASRLGIACEELLGRDGSSEKEKRLE